MMFEPISLGIVAAIAASLPGLLRAVFGSVEWMSPVFILGIAALAMVLQRFLLDRRPGQRNYDGLADLFIHIHSPSTPDTAERWSFRGILSLVLTLFGAPVGTEGAAVEFAQSLGIKLRPRSSRWFEQRRRTDAATAIASGVAAAFLAPFSGVLFAMELGVGGRALSAALGALTSFLMVKYVLSFGPFPGASLQGLDLSGALYSFEGSNIKEWIGVILITLCAGIVSAALVRFFRYCQDSLLDLFQTQAWMRTLAGGVLLFLVVFVYKEGHAPVNWLMEQVLWGKKGLTDVGLTFFTLVLGFSLIVSAFGSIGVLWPIFAIGGVFGYGIYLGLLHQVSGFGALAGLTGAAGFFGAVLGAPLTGAVLAFEITQNTSVLVPCLIAGFGARKICQWLKTQPMAIQDLESRGVKLIEGRSASVLDSILVREAMITDHETIHEHEPVMELYQRLRKSKYPFFPLVNSQGLYSGLLTADMVQEGWEAQDPLTSNLPLSKLLEAKDLLYRSRFKSPVVKASDRLTQIAPLFSKTPCVPVVGDDGRVLGLLFAYSVRLAYDREVARRSLSLQHQAKS